MELNDFNGLGAGRLRSSIKDVGMNGKSTEKPFSTWNNGGQTENEDKGGLGIGVGRQKKKTAYDLGIITPKIISWSWLCQWLTRGCLESPIRVMGWNRMKV
jgi:hypothetical protein